MSTLEGKSIATTYKDLLQVSNNNIGVDSTIRAVEDGEGTQSALALSTDTVEIRGPIIPSTNATFDIGTAERKIRHLYLSSNSLYVGDLQFSEQDLQEVKNMRSGAYATSTQGALAETALQPGAFSFDDLSSKPTTLAGYGITDAATAAQGDAADTALAKANTALQPGGVRFTNDITDRPTTLAGYGITDAFDGNFSSLLGTPTSLAGYGIVDAATAAQGALADSALQPGDNVAFSNVTNTPTSLAGYGIVDAATAAQGALADSALQPGDNVSFSNVTNTPVTLAGYGITNAATSTQGDKADTALQPDTEIHVNTMHLSGGKIFGPATMYIDPEAIGDNTGKLVILGDLQVDGVTTTVNSTTVAISDKNFEIAKGATTLAQADGAGLLINPDISMLYQAITDSIIFNKTLTTNGDIRINDQTNGATRKIVFDMTNTGGAQTDISIKANNGDLSFYSDAQAKEYMRINSTGNVGIGVTAPAYKLDVAGDINMTGALKVNGQDAVFSNWTNQDDGSISRASDVDVTGDVGVSGVMSVGNAFTVSSDGTVGGTTPTTVGQVVTWDGAKWVAADNTGGGSSSGQSEVPAAFSVALTQGQSVHTVNFTNTYDTIPAVVTDLQITGDGDIIPYVITAVTTSSITVTFAEVIPNNNYKLNISFGGRDVYWNPSDLNTINYLDGNVGIGAVTPTGGDIGGKALEIKSSAASVLRLNRTNGQDAPVVDYSIYAGSQSLTFHDNINDTARMVLKDGNVGIGTTNPGSYRLKVEGGLSVNTLSVGAEATSTSAAYFNGQGYRNDNDHGLLGHIKFDNQNGGNTAGKIEVYAGGSTTSGTMRFHTSGSEKMRITANGDVGIGTTNPASALHVDSSGDGPIFDSGGTGNTNHALLVRDSANNQLLRVNNDGNVGIGTTNPSQGKLVTTGYGGHSNTRSFVAIAHNNNVESYFRIARMGSGDSTSISLANNYNRDVPAYQADDNTAGISDITFRDDGSLSFSTGAVGTTEPVEKMRIEASGNVGIGVTNPSQKLEVSGHLFVNNGQGIFKRNSTSGPFYAEQEGSGPAGAFLGGNVGIGTTNPLCPLHVSGSTKKLYATIGDSTNNSFNSPTVVMRLCGDSLSTGAGPGLAFNAGVECAQLFGIREDGGAGGALFIKTLSTSTGQMVENFRIKQDGKVGIGTSSPSQRLHVAGNIYATGSITPSSDDRVKHNEQPIVGALEALSKITPKKYIKTNEMYDADHDFELDAGGNPVDANGEPVEHNIEAGVIAQQVLTVDELAFTVSPEGVDEDGNVTSPHGLDYNSLFTYAIAAIQEQQATIDQLKTQNESLISRIETLENN
jgi:hypothetical protein